MDFVVYVIHARYLILARLLHMFRYECANRVKSCLLLHNQIETVQVQNVNLFVKVIDLFAKQELVVAPRPLEVN